MNRLTYTLRIACAGLACLATTSVLRVAAEEPLTNWKHSGTLAILTTPQGADLPPTARVAGFPLLVRLSKETFPFSQARADGGDLRFSSAGRPLAYQIDHWDAEQGVAAIWVRVPLIKGDERQLITMHWGHTEAASASNGNAVFNADNGYVAALHLGDSRSVGKDEVGTVTPVDAGTEAIPGVIGFARRFAEGKGIACGEKINGLPVGAHPCTTQAWLKAEQVNGTVVGWGNEQGQGKVVMQVRSPPHINLDCYFSSANVASTDRLPMSEWVQVTHTYLPGESLLYINGQLAGKSARRDSPLNIRTPARMWLGGWYGMYQLRGALDEVRISNVERSADWVRLEYENQKPLQTLVGTLVQPGDEFSVSPRTLELNEGARHTFSAKAGGAEKVSWRLVRDGRETVVAVDQFTYVLEAGRVVGDSALTVRLQAAYPRGTKTYDVAVTIKDTLPEPRFTLRAPTSWNGRDPIEVTPAIENLSAMQAAGAGELRTRWVVSGGAVLQQVAEGRLVLKRAQFSGRLSVRAEIDNGGQATIATTSIDVMEPKTDPWLARVPRPDEQPEEGQFYARDASGQGTLYYNGLLAQPAEAVFLRVFADDKPYAAEKQPHRAGQPYSFAIKLKPGLIKYRVEFGAVTKGEENILARVGDLVCGDAYLISGQSNALATDTREESPRETHEWIRSYGGPSGRGDGAAWVRAKVQAAQQAGLARPNLWCRPVWKRSVPEHQAELGWWGMELAKRLVASQKIPICIINAAVGGTRIDEHQPTPGNHGDLSTIYGRMLWRLQQARLEHQIRGVIWHQGESDQGADGPTGGFGWETYQQYFVTLAAAWKEDLPNLERYYVFQIWPNACAMGGREGAGDRLREAQRTLPRLFSKMTILSTHGIKPPGGCHFPLEGWAEFARLLQPHLERDFYGKPAVGSISPPDLRSARFANLERTEIALEFEQPVIWNPELASQFYLADQAGEVVSGSAAGNVVTLKLKGPSDAARLTYLKERDWRQDRLLLGANGLAALTFCDVTILPPKE